MNASTMFPSKYLAGVDFEDEDRILTITSLDEEEIDDKEKGKILKYIIWFKEEDKSLILNKTNVNNLIGLFGPETDDWVNQRVYVGASEVDFQGKTTMAVRIRIKKPKPIESKKRPPVADEDVFADD